MADLDKVLKGLSQCMMADNMEGYETQCRDCPYFNPEVTVQECIQPLKNDAIALLKEQEAVEPIPFHRSDGTIFKYECRKCRTKIFKMDLFCRHCGRSVKWN